MQTIWTFLVAARFIPLTLHIVGCYLLFTRSSCRNSNERLLLLQLGIAEIFLCLIPFVLSFLYFNYGDSNPVVIAVYIFQLSFFLSFYLFMIVITINRFAEVYLSIRYPLYWSVNHTKKLIVLAWLINLAFFGSLLVYYLATSHYKESTFSDVLVHTSEMYIFPILDVLVMTFALGTYGYIVKKLMATRVQVVPSNTIQNTAEPSTRNGNIKKLLLPVLLMTTYLVFSFLPSVVVFYKRVNGNIANVIGVVQQVRHAMFTIGLISDALIYIFLSTDVSKNAIAFFFRTNRN